MKKTFILFVTLILSVWATTQAQTQQGYVKTLGRPEKAGQPLGGVTIRVKGEHNAVYSQDDGTFSILMTDKKNGDAYTLQQVQKNDYELNETDIIGRQFAFSGKVPLTIVMVSSSVLRAEKQRIEDNANRTAVKNYKAKEEALKKQLQENAITEQQYREQLADLHDKFEKYQSLIDGLAEHYAHTDYDMLSETDREINLCIENGELERADSLIRLLFDPIGVLQRNMEALASIGQQIGQAQGILAQANEDMAAVLKQQEKDAEYLYQLYTISVAKYDFDNAIQYLLTRAELDTTRAEWQDQAADLLRQQNQLKQAEFYRNRVLSIYRKLAITDPETHSVNVADALCDLATFYMDENRLAESEQMFLEALNICDHIKESTPDYIKVNSVTLKAYSKLCSIYLSTQQFQKCKQIIDRNIVELMQLIISQEGKPDFERNILQNFGNVLYLVHMIGSFMIEEQNYQDCENLYLDIIEFCPALTEINPAFEIYHYVMLVDLASLYSKTNRWGDAEPLYLEALSIIRKFSEQNPQAHEYYLANTLIILAHGYFDAQQYSKCEHIYLEAIEIFNHLTEINLYISETSYQPTIALCWYRIGWYKIYNNQFQDAITPFENALSIYRELATSNPDLQEMYFFSLSFLNLAYSQTKDYVASYNCGLELIPLIRKNQDAFGSDFAATLSNQSFNCIFIQKFEESEQNAREALSIDSTQHWIYSNLAASLLFQGKYDEAEAIYRHFKNELKDAFLQDFNDFETAGIIPKERKADVGRIRKMLME